jgi:hypothetical protein
VVSIASISLRGGKTVKPEYVTSNVFQVLPQWPGAPAALLLQLTPHTHPPIGLNVEFTQHAGDDMCHPTMGG